MSMILDALQRADRERRKQDHPPPSLETPTTPPPAKSSAPRGAWWLAGLGLMLVVALSLVVLSRPTPSPVQSGPAAARSIQPREPAAPEPTSAPTAGQSMNAPNSKPPAIAELYQSPQVEDDSITALYRSAQGGDEPVTDEVTLPIEGTDGHTQTLPQRPEPAAVRLSESEPVAERPRREAAVPTPDEATVTPPETTPPTSEENPKIASVRDLPWNLQQTMPSISYQEHHYRNGAASRVRLNGKEYRAGERVAQDLTLERIEEDGAVMRYRGYEFKLQALNSWVNM